MNPTEFGPLLVSYADVEGAAQRIAGKAHRTPVLTSASVDERTGAKAFFKCENFQRMGAFKFRGAYNALALLSEDEKKRGVLAYSSGNHAQAVALAGRMLGVAPVIVMPMDAPPVKQCADCCPVRGTCKFQNEASFAVVVISRTRCRTQQIEASIEVVDAHINCACFGRTPSLAG